MKENDFNNCCGQMLGADGSVVEEPKSKTKTVLVVLGLVAFAAVSVMLLKKVIK